MAKKQLRKTQTSSNLQTKFKTWNSAISYCDEIADSYDKRVVELNSAKDSAFGDKKKDYEFKLAVMKMSSSAGYKTHGDISQQLKSFLTDIAIAKREREKSIVGRQHDKAFYDSVDADIESLANSCEYDVSKPISSFKTIMSKAKKQNIIDDAAYKDVLSRYPDSVKTFIESGMAMVDSYNDTVKKADGFEKGGTYGITRKFITQQKALFDIYGGKGINEGYPEFGNVISAATTHSSELDMFIQGGSYGVGMVAQGKDPTPVDFATFDFNKNGQEYQAVCRAGQSVMKNDKAIITDIQTRNQTIQEKVFEEAELKDRARIVDEAKAEAKRTVRQMPSALDSISTENSTDVQYE